MFKALEPQFDRRYLKKTQEQEDRQWFSIIKGAHQQYGLMESALKGKKHCKHAANKHCSCQQIKVHILYVRIPQPFSLILHCSRFKQFIYQTKPPGGETTTQLTQVE